MEMVYKTPIETRGVKKTMLLLKIFRMPISPSLRVLTKKGKAANEIALQREPVTVYAPTCLTESLSKISFRFCNKAGGIGLVSVIVSVQKR